MTPRKATLRVAHQGNCPNAKKTALDSVGKGSGCKCEPSYYTMWRDTSGATRKSERVKNRRVADAVRNKKQTELDEGRGGLERQKNLAFPEWVDEYKAILEARPGIRSSTEDTYARSLAIAVDAIGHVNVRQIANPELRKFHKAISHASDATVGKHLTHLSACLTAAVADGYADRNPVGPFRKSLGLRPGRGTPPYTDGELARLLGALRHEEPVYLALVRVAVETGARVGELIALDWSNVDLTEGKLRIRHTFSGGVLSAPKDEDERDVYLTPRASRAFTAWVRRAGVHGSGLVFPAPRSGGYVNADYLRKLILAAWEAAGIAKIDPQSRRPRKPLHSLRATFARRMLEQGRHPQWVEAQMGHADLELTVQVYGAWSDEAMRAEAAREMVAR